MSSLSEPAPVDPAELPWIRISPDVVLNVIAHLKQTQDDYRSGERAALIRQLTLTLGRTEHWRSFGLAAE